MNQTHLRDCLRDPIPEIYEAARLLDAAVTAHNRGNLKIASELFRMADDKKVRDWSESLWGAKSPYIKLRKIPNVAPYLDKGDRVPIRMPNTTERDALHQRDGFHCRFCTIPVIRKEVREMAKRSYPDSVSWGRTNLSQHAAFQAMWLQYDHIVPHARGGNNDIVNIVITCAPCNYSRMQYLCEEVGLNDPRKRAPYTSWWDGLERFRM